MTHRNERTLQIIERIKAELEKKPENRTPLSEIAREFGLARQMLYKKKDAAIVRGLLPLKARNY